MLEPTANLIENHFKPQEVQLKRLQGLERLPDILVLSDLDGSKWGDFKTGQVRTSYNPGHTRSNATAFNQYADRFLVADLTGQDERMTGGHLAQTYKDFVHLDFLANNNGLTLHANTESVNPVNFVRNILSEAKNHIHHAWESFIALFVNKPSFYEFSKSVLEKNRFKAIELNEANRPPYIYPNCHELYRSEEYPGIDISISPGETSLVAIDSTKGTSINPQIGPLLKNLCDQVLEKISSELTGDQAHMAYNLSLREDFGYAFFIPTEPGKQISKATLPFAILKSLPAQVVNALKAVICIGDSTNDLHLALTEIPRANGKTLPVHRIVSGKGLYEANPSWLNRDSGRIEIATTKGDIAEALHKTIFNIDQN